MPWIEAVKLAGAFAVPLVAVAALFYGMMNVSIKHLRDELKSLADTVHSLDVRLARLEERIPSIDWRQPAS
ncbi:MAG: hypothetical protein OXE41_06780 [Gammaproteobacteria bacterium]|nr:hypothetical protein [Gammaproteobacteria bacterium]MCY4275081.1 hypothetical protein [Gammaproteobacteria bacterium]